MPFCTQNGNFWVGVCWSPKFFGSKNRFFSIFQKCLLITFYPWIWPGNVFWRLWGRVSDNFQVAMVVLSPHAKIWNFQKMRFLWFSGFFDAGRFARKKAQKFIKKWKFSKTCSLDPKDASRYLGWHFMMIRSSFQQHWKSTKISFLLQNNEFGAKMIFLLIFNVAENLI